MVRAHASPLTSYLSNTYATVADCRPKELVLCDSPQCIYVQHPYPSAAVHVIVISRQQGMSRLASLQGSDVSHVEAMQAMAQEAAERILADAPAVPGASVLRMGIVRDSFNSRLHLHIVSSDIGSLGKDTAYEDPVDYLVPMEAVLARLRGAGQLAGLPLQCRACGLECTDVAQMKQHLRSIHGTG